MPKDFTNLRTLAMGHIDNEDLAMLCIHQTSTSADLQSVLRAAHDRIMHLSQLLVRASVAYSSTLGLISPQAEERQVVLHVSTAGSTPADVERMVESFTTTNLDALTPDASLSEEAPAQEATELEPAVTAADDSVKVEETVTMDVVILTQPELTRNMVLEAALARGFKTRPQKGGPDDLNEYVYDFAADIHRMSRPDHHMVNIAELPRFSVYENNGQVVIQNEPEGVYSTFDSIEKMLEEGRIDMEPADDDGQQPG